MFNSLNTFFICKTLIAMKKIFLILAILFGFQLSYAALLPMSADKNANSTVSLNSGETKTVHKKISEMSVKEFEAYTHKKLNFFERIAFKAYKKKLAWGEDSEGFNVGGFALGFFLGLLGVIGAYIFSKDRNFRKWTWAGWGAWVAIILVIIAAGNK